MRSRRSSCEGFASWSDARRCFWVSQVRNLLLRFSSSSVYFARIFKLNHSAIWYLTRSHLNVSALERIKRSDAPPEPRRRHLPPLRGRTPPVRSYATYESSLGVPQSNVQEGQPPSQSWSTGIHHGARKHIPAAPVPGTCGARQIPRGPPRPTVASQGPDAV